MSGEHERVTSQLCSSHNADSQVFSHLGSYPRAAEPGSLPCHINYFCLLFENQFQQELISSFSFPHPHAHLLTLPLSAGSFFGLCLSHRVGATVQDDCAVVMRLWMSYDMDQKGDCGTEKGAPR